MIKITNAIDGKVTKIKYENNDFEAEIDVHSFIVKDSTSNEFIGDIIEEYRKILNSGTSFEESSEFLDSKKEIITKFLNSSKYPFPDFHPDGVQIFYPSDSNRNSILKSFVEKMTLNITNDIIDFSKLFKKSTDRSIVNLPYEEASVLFELTVPDEFSTIEKLLIIDDTIDTGTTISILLDNLLINELISDTTEIKVIVMYNNAKTVALKKSAMDIYRENQEKKSNQ